jgi:hypothetical protein
MVRPEPRHRCGQSLATRLRVVSAEACIRGQIGRDEVADLLVADVMDPEPKTMPATITVGDLRGWFAADAHVRTALLTDGATFLGAVGPNDLPADAPANQLAVEFARRPANLIGPERPAGEALARLDAESGCRVVVLAQDDRTLLGLVCMDARRTYFCVPVGTPAAAGRYRLSR